MHKIAGWIEDDRIKHCEVCSTVECKDLQQDNFPQGLCCFHAHKEMGRDVSEWACEVCKKIGEKRVGTIG